MPLAAHARRQPAPPTAPATSRDRRVQDLERLVDSGDFDLLSLDVFDTLVWRSVPTPIDVHFLVARALAERGAVHASSAPESYVRQRIDAENRARTDRRSAEVTLAEIFAAFPRGFLVGLAPADVARIELEVERAVVRLNPDLEALLERAAARGMKTALVSDTYFTSRELGVLTGVRVDHVIASCEHGVSKATGLHRVLVSRSGVDPERILHVGDSYTADIEGPALLDIPRYWFRQRPDAWLDLPLREMPATLSARAPFVAEPDHGVTALRGRAMFRCATEHERWGAGILGPVVAGFCDWAIERCREIDAAAALCLMREGRILKQVIDLQEPGLPTAELFVSRFVALKSAILDGTEEELERFVVRPSPQPIARIAGQLGLDLTDLESWAAEATLGPEATRELVRRIVRTPRLRRAVVDSSAAARRHLLLHLGARVPAGGRRTVALVDLGYNGTIQGALQRILDRERTGIATHGLYLVTAGVHAVQSTGCAVEGWIADNHQPIAMAHTFMRSPEVFEQSLMADCGTTLGHREDGTPILDRVHIPDLQRTRIAEVQAGLLEYARAWAEHKAVHGPAPGEMLRRLARAICIRAVARPLEVELDLFGDWAHDENFGSATVRTLTTVTGLHEWERSHLSAHQLASLPSARVYWPFGYARTLGDTMAEAVAQIYLRTAPPEAFDSGHPPRPIALFWDEGRGFDPARSAVRELRLDNRGRAWHRFGLEVNGRTHLRYAIALGGRGDVIRLAGVRIHSRSERGESAVTEIGPERIENTGCRGLDSDLLRVEADGALFAFEAPGVRDFTGTVQVDVFLTLLPEA